MENKSIFKVGDKVYDIMFGWGEVVGVNDSNVLANPVLVRFAHGISTYTLEGVYLSSLNPTLSFTEYTLQGFSQERPFDPQDCVGKWCLTWDNGLEYQGKSFGKIIYINVEGDFEDEDNMLWNNAKPLTEEQLKAFNLTND